MKLTVGERLHLTGLLPQKGNAVTLRAGDEALKALSFSEKETKAVKLSFEPAVDEQGKSVMSYKWDRNKDKPVEVKFEMPGFKLLFDALEKLEKAEELPRDFLPLYDKFCDVARNA